MIVYFLPNLKMSCVIWVHPKYHFENSPDRHINQSNSLLDPVVDVLISDSKLYQQFQTPMHIFAMHILEPIPGMRGPKTRSNS